LEAFVTIKDAQQRVDAWISQFVEGYFPPLLNLARMTEEVGEIARVVAHMSGKKPKPGEDHGDLGMELADLLFVIICMANREGIDLEAKFAQVMEKYNIRDSNRWTKTQP
jgi:NTP pyrophosphatase (non-canonical NTP hydrolase)